LTDPREPRAEYDEAITDRLHPELIEVSRKIATAFGARLAGVDFVLRDPHAPLAGNGVFLELNATPGIHHHDTENLSPLPVAVSVLSKLLCVPEVL
jgi:D-alanine-D-alanine ligase-like ATP-grasp enzyme